MKTCSRCKEEKPLDEFHFRKNRGKPASHCKPCQRDYVNAHYKNNKQYYLDKAKKRNAEVKALHREVVLDYLRKHPCVDCGNDDLEVLQFDHRDEKLKTNHVGEMLTGSLERLLAEIEKCDIRCANCHVKRTRRQFGWWINEE